MRWKFVGYIFSVAFFLSPLLAYSATELELNEDDSIIVELRLGSHLLTDAMMVYANPDYTLVSFQEFLDGIEFPITVDSETQQASGWFVNQANTFELNIKNDEIHIQGKKSNLGDSFKYYSDEFDMYVDIESLKKWFNLDISLSMARLIMTVTSKEILPVEAREMRTKARTKKSTAKSRAKAHPWVADEYQWFSHPSFDVRINTSLNEFVEEDEETEIPTEESETDEGENSLLTPEFEEEEAQIGYAIQSSGDVMKHSTKMSIIQTDQTSPVSARITFTRKSLLPTETIGWGVTSYQFGDIYVQGDGLVSSGSPGVGINVHRNLSNALDQSFNRRDFEGDAPPGWEVELYRNGLYLSFQEVDESGRYVFKDIAVQFGENFFELRLYGTQGQTKTIKKRIQVGQEMISPGEWQFSASYLKDKDQLIGDPLLPGSVSRTGSAPEYISLTGIYGLFPQHSFGLGYDITPPAPNETEEQQYVRASWFAAFPWFSSRIDIAKDLNAGSAISAKAFGRFFSQDVNIETVYFDEFYTIKSNYGNTIQTSDITIFGNLPAFKLRQLPYSLGLTHEVTGTETDRNERFLLENRLSLSFGGYRLSNEITAQASSGVDEVVTRGAFTFSRAVARTQIRGNVNYFIDPTEATSFSMAIDYKVGTWSYQLSGGTSLGEEQNRSLNFDVTKLFRNASLSITGATDFEGNNSIALSVDFGILTRREKPYFFPSRYGTTGSGTLRNRVFLDENGNGDFDRGEVPLENVKFKGRTHWRNSKTDAAGEVVLTGLDTNLGSVVTIDTISLDDPYLYPVRPSFRISSHPGAYRVVDVPVTQITEVEGYLYLMKGESSKPVGGATVGLFKDGKEIVRTKSEFDGYYLFPRVVPGKYTASIVDDEGVMSKYTWEMSEEFETDMDSGITSIEDIIVRFKPENPPPGTLTPENETTSEEENTETEEN